MLITTDWFRSDGIKYGYDKKPEICFIVDSTVKNILSQIENEIVRQIQVPAQLLQQQDISSDVPLHNLYRSVVGLPKLYGKLQHDCLFFDNRGKVIRKDQTSFGDYRVLLHVKGLYIGPHHQKGKLASLQMRVVQVQYKEGNFSCLMDAAPGLTRNPAAVPARSIVMTPQPVVTQITAPSAPKKAPRGRKVKPLLQRQNAVIDIQPMETFPADIFDDLDI